MNDLRIAVVGIGATGTVLAAALLSKKPGTILIAPRQNLRERLLEYGVNVSGVLSYHVPVRHVVARISDMKDLDPDVILLSTKTFNLGQVIDELKTVFRPGTKIVSTHNGLGTEDLIAESFGVKSALRMSLNFGASLKGPADAAVAFFNKPNYLGGLSQENREVGLQIAALLTDCGLETQFVDDIKLYVWKKMVMKCTMASICAVTDKTIKEALEFQPTREIAEACFREVLSVARAMGYDLGENYLVQAMGYLEQVGVHKDSMCHDIAAKKPTEIDFLGGKVVEYARLKGVATPFYIAVTNLVKAIESNYARG